MHIYILINYSFSELIKPFFNKRNMSLICFGFICEFFFCHCSTVCPATMSQSEADFNEELILSLFQFYINYKCACLCMADRKLVVYRICYFYLHDTVPTIHQHATSDDTTLVCEYLPVCFHITLSDCYPLYNSVIIPLFLT